MPRKSQQRYPENWSDIALLVKQSVDWRCSKCGLQCIRPGEENISLSKYSSRHALGFQLSCSARINNWTLDKKCSRKNYANKENN